MRRQNDRKKIGPVRGFLRFIGRLITAMVLLVVFFLLSCVAINLFMIASTTNNLWTEDELTGLQADYVLVLGASLNQDGTPSSMLAERMDQGIALYRNGAAERLLLSGDGSRDQYYNEANAMRRYALERNVPDEAIILDENGLSTFDSIAHAYETYGAESLVIVSQRYHLYRSVYIGESFGLQTYGVPSDRQDWPNQEVREIPARIKDFIRTLIPLLPDTLEPKGHALLTQLTEKWKMF